MKREVLTPILALLILSSLSVYAAPNADVDLVPDSLYETNEIQFNLTVNNFLKDEVIDEILLSMPNFIITEVTDFLGWQHNETNNSVNWFGGDIETNVFLAMFQFMAKADKVSSDTTVTVNITTEGNGDTVDSVNITILNDDTAPVLSNNVPANGDYLLEGITDQLVSVDAVDAQTGVGHVDFSYWNCSNATNTTVNISLAGVNDTYTDTVNLADYEEGELMCFLFEGYNNADEVATLSGSVGFDGTPPTVNLTAPDDGAYASDATLFSFIAADNIAPTLDCDFKVEGDVKDSTTVDSGVETSTTYNLSGTSEGTHSWTVTCKDLVGLEATASSRDVIIDLTAPTITLNSPANSSFINDDAVIDINVTDNFEVDTVNYSRSLNISAWSEGLNVLTVNATDKAGNTAEETFEFTVDRTAPSLTLISPDDNSSTDVHVDFVFNVNDFWDDAIECTIYLDDSEYLTQEVDGLVNISVVIPMALYEWYIECSDDAGNSVESERRNLNVTDLTGPDMAMDDIVYVIRGEDYDFSVNISDPSGIDDVDAEIDGDSISLSASGDVYSGVISTDLSDAVGDYNLTITAVDSLANSNQLVEEFELLPDYDIDASLSPSSVNVGGDVTVSGVVVLDDGSAIPETEVILLLPDSTTVYVTLDNGSFSYNFSAPLAKGNYDIVVEVETLEGIVHSETLELTVTKPASSSSSTSSGKRSVGRSTYCGDGLCSYTEDCTNCEEDCGVCPVEEEEPVEEASLSGGIIEEEEEEQDNIPVGKAAGWFSLSKLVQNPYIWVGIIAVVGILSLLSYKRKGGGLNWDGYFDR
ncbi:hypothetical protein KY331_02780 [Candidatus Woesearchaeota archaeon]|nr:hypothetical protein [Candidatus Woesearchaeota archaeon]